ncbi:Spc98 family-domain-containing protein [Pilobolus umbonatus]|nr:Spc98 family-domain-containing protein [Pilobolus umbonatus]
MESSIDFIEKALNSVLSSPGLQSMDREHTNYIPPVSRPYEIPSNEPVRNTRRRLTPETSVPPQPMEVDNLPPALQLKRARRELFPVEGYIHVTESELLRDLIYIFQGIDGQYIKFDVIVNEYTIKKEIDILPSARDMIYRLSEIGWLYRQVQTFIKQNTHSPNIGLVAQSLCSALQYELKDYYKMISILESQIEKQLKGTGILTEHSLTLTRLMVWTMDSLRKLKLMSVLVDVCKDKKGGALVSVMHNYTKHGDPFLKQYIIGMIEKVSSPFYEMLQRWVYEGELDDPYDEFFVACDEEVSDDQLWQSKYSIREGMLPSFISKEIAQKICSIGKSLNFIRYSCHDDTLIEHYNTLSSNIEKQTFQYGDIRNVERSIDMIYLDTSRELLNLLKHKYKLMDHLRALKRYLLLGQGDFIQYLMDILGQHLNKPANSLYRHNLTGTLDSAIRSSNAQYDDPEVLNRLDVRLLEIVKGDLGWDVFTLDYHVDPPINTVFNPLAMKQYLAIFNFLWRLKRVEYTLSASWREWGNASREFMNLPDMVQDLHLAQLSIQRMIHFIYQLQHYVLFEVLECSWDKLETCIENKCIDLDGVIQAHSNYLAEITEKGFLKDGKQANLSKSLNHLFDGILEYKSKLDGLYSYAHDRSFREANGILDDEDQKMKEMRKEHEEMSSKFNADIEEFLNMLKSYHDEDLRSLSTRLDYNDFYSSNINTA